MKIVFSREGFVDFDAPVVMREDQRDAFQRFLQELFDEQLAISEVREVPGHPPGASKPRRWTSDDLLQLLDQEPNSELAARLGRSNMSIRMKRGEFVMDFLAWMRRRGHPLPARIEYVEEFLREASEVGL